MVMYGFSADVTCVTGLTSCRAGIHRGVAMAERLAKEVEGGAGQELEDASNSI